MTPCDGNGERTRAQWAEYIVDAPDQQQRRHIAAAHAKGTEAEDLLFVDDGGDLVLAIARGEWALCRRVK